MARSGTAKWRDRRHGGIVGMARRVLSSHGIEMLTQGGRSGRDVDLGRRLEIRD